MRLEIQAVDGHFVLFGATVYAAGGYGEAERLGPVSYTHLDVYKRQSETWALVL